MKRFPSSHGARVVFDPLRTRTPNAASGPIRQSGSVPRGAPIPRDEEASPPPAKKSKPGPAKERSPSYVEIDMVEANLQEDPRYDEEDKRR